MACNTITLTNIEKDCKNTVGGVKEIWIIDSSKVDKVETKEDTGKITAFALAEGSTFSHWQFRPETASMTHTANIDNAAGTMFITTELALQFSKMESVKRLQIKAATIGDFKVIVRDTNDMLWYLGVDNDVTATAVTGATGQAMGDFNGYNITLSDFSKDYPYQIEMSAEDLKKIGVQY